MATVDTEHDVVVDAGEELNELVGAIGSGGGEDFSIRAFEGSGSDTAEGEWKNEKRELRRDDVVD